MVKREIFILFTFAVLASANEIEDVEQKKRGAGKANALNAIPTGAQKSEYTYNIYSQNPNIQNPSQSYQPQSTNSFYPSQDSSTYYNPGNIDAQSTSPPQPQPNVPQQTIQSSFIPINFLPNPGYQAKYQLISTKSSGNIQLAILPQPSGYPSPPLIQYPQSLFSSTPSHMTPQNNQLINSFGAPGQYFASNFQFPSPVGGLGGHALSHPSAMLLLPQTNPALYNNLLYPNPSQSFYNYYPSQSQAKYSYSSGSPISSSNEYDKPQTTVPQSISKEGTDVNIQSGEYAVPSDASSGYKTTYSRRSTYTKFK